MSTFPIGARDTWSPNKQLRVVVSDANGANPEPARDVAFRDFIRDNKDDEGLLKELRALRVGDSITAGGGAQPLWTITRIENLSIDQAREAQKKRGLSGLAFGNSGSSRLFHDSDAETGREIEDGDLTTEDHIHFYQYGKLALTLQTSVPFRRGGRGGGGRKDAGPGDVSDASMWRQLDAFMQESNFWPNVWWISDHGNAHLMQRPKRKR